MNSWRILRKLLCFNINKLVRRSFHAFFKIQFSINIYRMYHMHWSTLGSLKYKYWGSKLWTRSSKCGLPQNRESPNLLRKNCSLDFINTTRRPKYNACEATSSLVCEPTLVWIFRRKKLRGARNPSGSLSFPFFIPLFLFGYQWNREKPAAAALANGKARNEIQKKAI
jgi:hypothetical protein